LILDFKKISNIKIFDIRLDYFNIRTNIDLYSFSTNTFRILPNTIPFDAFVAKKRPNKISKRFLLLTEIRRFFKDLLLKLEHDSILL
jgi:hypothetical protein